MKSKSNTSPGKLKSFGVVFLAAVFATNGLFLAPAKAAPNDATVTSATYTVSAVNGGVSGSAETITGVPFGTPQVAFLAALVKGDPGQTWNLSGLADPIATGNALIVTAQDATTTITYNIETLPPVLSSAKSITEFTISAGTSTIDQAARTIFVAMPNGTDLAALSPAITIIGVSISPATSTPVDFTNPVTYTVTAENGSTRNYVVTVKTENQIAPVIAAHDDVLVDASSTPIVVDYMAPMATDNIDAPAAAVCTPSSGSLFAVGTTTVTCTKTDSDNNAATPTTFFVVVTDTNAMPPVDPVPENNQAPSQDNDEYAGGVVLVPGPIVSPTVTAINVPLVISGVQEGALIKNLNGGTFEMFVPRGSVQAQTAFNVSSGMMNDAIPEKGAVSSGVYMITTSDINGTPVKPANKLNVTVSGLHLASSSAAQLGVYNLDETVGEWRLVPGNSVDHANGVVKFSLDHFSRFVVLDVSGRPDAVKVVKAAAGQKPAVGNEPVASQAKTLNPKNFAEGTVMRDTNKKIYVVEGGKLKYIPNLKELAKYKGRVIVSVNSETGKVGYPDGTLVRIQGDKKVFVITKGKKQHIKTLAALKQYKSKPILSVSASSLSAY